jgi:hypothetical protein
MASSSLNSVSVPVLQPIMASSQSCVCVINTRMALSTTHKGNLMIAKYVGKMKALADDMASAGKKLDDEDLVGYILFGLDNDFDSVISAVVAHVEPINMSDLYGHLVYHEQRQELRGKEYSTANAASRGWGNPPQRGVFGRGCDCGHGGGRNNYNNSGEQNPKLMLSAICVAKRVTRC